MSTTNEEPKKPSGGVLYALDDKSVVTRHDKKLPGSKPVAIGAVVKMTDGVESSNVFRYSHPDFVRYENQVKGLLKKNGIEATIEPYVVREPVTRDAMLVREFDTDGTPTAEGPTTTTGNATPLTVSIDTSDNGPDGMRHLTVDQRKAVNYLRSKEGYPIGELERVMPLAPAKTSGAGDKTPEYVKWLLRYDPAGFVARYGVQRIGSIEITVPGPIDPVTKIRKPATRKWEPGHVLARRATIFTDVTRTNNPADAE